MVFTPHARDKIERLKHLGITEATVISLLLNPGRVDDGYFNRKVAQGALRGKAFLRVVFEETNNTFLVITVYPASGGRYAN